MAEPSGEGESGSDSTTVLSEQSEPERLLGMPYEEPNADPMAIVFPPFFIVGLSMFGLIVLSWITQKMWWKFTFKKHRKEDLMDFNEGNVRANLFLTEKEESTLLELAMFQNRPLVLLKIAMPALLSMAFCPLSLYLYMPMVKYFWPPTQYTYVPNVNDAIQAFLTPAGLVYAIAFGFAFQEATAIQSLVTERIAIMVDCCFNIAQNCMTLNHIFSQEDRARIICILKEEGIIWIRQLLAYSHTIIEHKSRLSEIISIISANQYKLKNPLDKLFIKNLINYVYDLEKLTLKSLGKMCGSMNILQWVFLEALAYLAFFGVLMLNAHSYKFQVCICIITVFSISFFCYILADLDNPYHGMFRVDLSLLPALIQGLSEIAAKNGNSMLRCSRFNLKSNDNGRLSLDNIVVEKLQRDNKYDI